MPYPSPWDPPSPSVAELIRAATAAMLADSERLFDQIDDAILAGQEQELAFDEPLADAIKASTRSNLAHWAAANIAEPGTRVAPNMVPETVELAREIVRRGYDDTALSGYRIGQNIAWRLWMQTAFSVSRNADELREMLDITSRSVFTFVDDMLAALQLEMNRERAQLGAPASQARLALVRRVLAGENVGPMLARREFDFDITSPHVAAIVWSDRIGPRDLDALRAVADDLHQALRPPWPGRPLTVTPNQSTLWGWFPTQIFERPVVTGITPPAGIRVAVGVPRAQADGFRDSHQQAELAQELMRRMPYSRELQVATYQQLEVLSLATADGERANQFVQGTLDRLLEADPVLRDTLRVYLREQFNVSRTARALFAHRNTVLARIQRAEQLLNVSLAEHALEVALALEIEHRLWPRR
jgi:DNA-binding PucR family transcriptional regulator